MTECETEGMSRGRRKSRRCEKAKGNFSLKLLIRFDAWRKSSDTERAEKSVTLIEKKGQQRMGELECNEMCEKCAVSVLSNCLSLSDSWQSSIRSPGEAWWRQITGVFLILQQEHQDEQRQGWSAPIANLYRRLPKTSTAETDPVMVKTWCNITGTESPKNRPSAAAGVKAPEGHGMWTWEHWVVSSISEPQGKMSGSRFDGSPSLLQGRHFYCREWALEKLRRCLDARSLSGQAPGLLVTGGPGAGKTALCTEVVWPTSKVGLAMWLAQRCLASHFCQREDQRSTVLWRFVLGLVGQLRASPLLPPGYEEVLNRPLVASALEPHNCQKHPEDTFKRFVLLYYHSKSFKRVDIWQIFDVIWYATLG